MFSILVSNLDYLLFVTAISMLIVSVLSIWIEKQQERRVDGFWLGLFCLFASLQAAGDLCKRNLEIEWLPMWGFPAMGILAAISLLSLGQRARNDYTGVPWAISIAALGAFIGVLLLVWGIDPVTVTYVVAAFLICIAGLYATKPFIRADHTQDPSERLKLKTLGVLLAAWSIGEMGVLVLSVLKLEGHTESWSPQAIANLLLLASVASTLLVPLVWWLTYPPQKVKKSKYSSSAFRLFPMTYCALILLGWLAPAVGQKEYEKHFKDELLKDAIKTAAAIPPDRVKNLTFTDKDAGQPYFEMLQEQLKAHGTHVGQSVIYTVAQRNNNLYFGPENIDPSSDLASPPGSVYNKPPAALWDAFTTRKPRVSQTPYRDEFNAFISAFAPVLDPRTKEVIMMVGIDRYEIEWAEQLNRERFYWIIGFGVVTLLLVSPLAVLSRRKHRHDPDAIMPARHFESIMTCCLGIICTGTLCYMAYRGETRNRTLEFERMTEAYTQQALDQLNRLNNGVESIALHYQGNLDPSAENFRAFVEPQVNSSSLYALAWVPKVTLEQRPALEAKMRAAGHKDFTIYEIGENDLPIAAPQRPEYFPFLYYEPIRESSWGPGYDVLSNTPRRQAMESAVLNDQAIASTPVLLLSDTGKADGVLVFRPVALNSTPPRTRRTRNELSWVKGFAVGVIRLHEILDSAAIGSQVPDDSLTVGLIDPSLPLSDRLVATHPRGATTEWFQSDQTEIVVTDPLEQRHPIFTFGRPWGLIFHPTEGFYKRYPIRLTWIMLGSGVILTILGTAFVELLRSRKEKMEQEVENRTRALRESEWRWQFALEGAGEGVWDWNAQTNIVFYSRRWKEMLGYQDHELGNTLAEWDSRVHSEDKARCYEDLKSHFSGKTKIFINEHRIRCKDGSYIWVLDRGTVVEWTPDHKPLRVIGTHTDITRQKNIEAGLRESEARFRQFVEQAPTAIAMFDINMRYLAASRQWYIDYGLSGTEIIGRLHYEIFPEVDDEWKTIHRHCLAGHVERREEDRFERKDGTVQWLQWEVRPWYNTMGQIAGLLMFTLDVTVQRNAREEIGRVRDRLNATLQALPDLLMEIDFVGRVHEYRKPESWADLPSANDLTGHNISDLFSKEAVPAILAAVRQAANDTLVHDIKCKLTTDSADRWLELSVSRRSTLTGEPARFILLGRDVTEQLKNTEQVRASRDEAQRLNIQLQQSMDRANELAKAAQLASQAKSDFLASMSHEIRTPMTAIMGYAEMMLKPGRSPQEFEQWGRQIHRNADHLLSLINDLLDLSKIEAGQLLINRTSMNLVEMLESVYALFEPSAKEKTLDFKLVYTTKVPRLIITDPVRFKQVILNLVNNAVKFTDHGGITLRVQLIRNPADRAHLSISITDTGPGIPPDKRGKLFRSFSQLHDPNAVRKPGTGLGLAISKKLALLLGGDIQVESDPGVGSTFTFKLPLGMDDDLELVEGPLSVSEIGLSASSKRPTPELSGKHVLVVDDNPDNQRIITFMLEELGAIIHTSSNGLEAVNYLSKPGNNTQLVLMDMQMPVMDGYTATRTLREQGFALPIIALTAYAMSGDQEKCREAGCSGFVSKPIVPELLYKEILQQLAESRSSSLISDTARITAEDKLASILAPSTHYAEMSEDAPPVLTPQLAPGMADNPKFQALLKNYISAMPETIEKLREAIEHKDLDALRFMTHRLKGTAGNYGFPKITDIAGSAEKLIINQSPWDAIEQKTKRLIRYLEAASRAKVD